MCIRDRLDAMRHIKVPVLRWPGGCFVSSYHWKDAVGEKRTPFFDKAWRVEDPNTFGTDEYVNCLLYTSGNIQIGNLLSNTHLFRPHIVMFTFIFKNRGIQGKGLKGELVVIRPLHLPFLRPGTGDGICVPALQDIGCLLYTSRCV